MRAPESCWQRLRCLPLEVEAVRLEPLATTAPGGFERLTTVIVLEGGGVAGRGEDVTYDAADHRILQADRAWNDPAGASARKLVGRFELADFCALVASLDLFPQPPQREVSRRYRRWAFEAAALDLALRQGSRALAEVLGIEPRPVRFVVSTRLEERAGRALPDRVFELLERYPGTRFKLDPTNAWDDELCRQLAGTGAVDVLDLKGHYRGTPVDVETDPALYRRVLAAFPEAIIEDPDVTPATRPLLEPHVARLSFDAPVHEAGDVDALPFPVRHLNVKPSRIGSLAELFAVYALCAQRGIACYGGGQFELGPGRAQIQQLASLFHPDAPNDVAPAGYNEVEPPDGLPTSPLAPPQGVGFPAESLAGS